MAKKPKPTAILPPPVTAPPAGSYDPNLDASLSSAQRGYTDLQGDIERSGVRAASDFGLGQGQLETRRSQGLADIMRSRTRAGEDFGAQRAGVEQASGRSLSDILRSRRRGSEDYASSIANLNRQYSQLGDRQRQGAQQAGVARGGALQQAAAKRTANQALDRQPMDTNYGRFVADSGQAEQRLGQDKATSLGRIGTAETRAGEDAATAEQRLNLGVDTAQGDLALGYQRNNEDSTTKLQRAGRELGFFTQDTNANRFWQALNSGLWNGGAATPAVTPKRKVTG